MLKVYNTLTRKKEPFVTMEEGIVKMYVCGMTTYSDAHIGHARTYVAFDIMRRYLEYKGYEVLYVQNITDIDDKIIKAANAAKMDALEYSAMYAKKCLEDMENLGIKAANIYPKASEHINDMIELTKKLIDRGYAYVADGDVYFSVEKFEDYGKLSKQDMKQIKAGARIEPGEKKRKPEDFALWKAAKPGEPKWQSPWGDGRPGWHIECSTMSTKYLGIPFDIHGGGQDLIFPHHENEIAQSEAAYGRRFVNYWLHSGMLKVRGEKMSKSLGNIINIRDALQQWDAEALRFFFASYHYRSPADYSEEALKNAENAVKRLRVAKEKLEELAGKDAKFDKRKLDEKEKEYLEAVEIFKRKFEEAMDDDFNTPKAIEVIFDFVRKTNKFLMEKEKPDEKLCRYALNEYIKIANVLTLLQEEKKKLNEEAIKKLAEEYGVKADKAEDAIEKLLAIRRKAREEKNYKLADEIRDKLRQAGIEIEDVGKETKWRVA
ncbi:MAG: cysteine--tRNA ligase [Thermoplasmata archaeon]|nr:MAG: cysteine--tRNA ligase [Thermoplasmata archaeon]